MKTLNSYLFKEITVPFFLSLIIFTFVLLLDRMMQLIELVIGKGVQISDIGMLIVYIMPSFLTLTIPMSFLLALLLAFGRLSSDSEIIAMKASGISLYQMLIPVSILSVMAYTMTFYLFIYALPWGNQAFRVKVFDIASSKASTAIKEGVFNDDFEGVVMYVEKFENTGKKMHGIMIHDMREKQEYTIFAKDGSIVSDPLAMTITMYLKNGEIHNAGSQLSYDRISFKNYDMRLSFKASSEKRGDLSKGDREMTLAELKKKVAELRGRGENFKQFEVEIYKKYAIPFACIVFGLIGAPLGIQSRRSGRAWGFSLSLAIFLVYYISLTGGESLGDKGVIPPVLAVWGINVIFFFLGVYLIYMVGSERPIPLLAWIDRAMSAAEQLPKFIKGLIGRRK